MCVLAVTSGAKISKGKGRGGVGWCGMECGYRVVAEAGTSVGPLRKAPLGVML